LAKNRPKTLQTRFPCRTTFSQAEMAISPAGRLFRRLDDYFGWHFRPADRSDDFDPLIVFY